MDENRSIEKSDFPKEGVCLLKFGQRENLQRLYKEGEMHWTCPLLQDEPPRELRYEDGPGNIQWYTCCAA